ncbi:MAG: right-handed parallel beta-helix repeat-containing protein [Deltaproteobacteria bacterium]|nr:right-handed parallel beta-helix repeat-containing protein [Deltaproteobacteria bacterium]
MELQYEIGRSGWNLGGDVKRFCLSMSLAVVFLVGTVSFCAAADDAPADTGRYSVIIENNVLYQNCLVGVRIQGTTPVEIRRCKIYSNGMAGIAVDREAKVTVTGCDVSRNGTGGINVGKAEFTTLENNTIPISKVASSSEKRSQRETDGIAVKILNNKIYMNNEGGIRSIPRNHSKVDLLVVGNDIYENRKGGLRVENSTKLRAKGNDIHKNGTLGIASLQSHVPPELDIYQNSVRFNGGPGIHVINGLTGDMGIRNNWVYNNHRSGIACGLVDDPTTKLLDIEIINNTIVSNGSGGQGAGIRNDSKGKVTILNNVVAYNYVTGIMTRGCEDYSYNLLFENGYVGQEIQDVGIGVDWAKALQYAGCMEGGKGDFIGDPLFVNPDTYNFNLRSESPAVDAGSTTSIYNDVSFPPSKGGDRNDMGATGGPYAIQK